LAKSREACIPAIPPPTTITDPRTLSDIMHPFV
jgi:hypothetical protein